FLRTVGWERVARAELDLLDAESMATLQAYSDGVNAYLADHEGTELSLEYLFLGLLNSDYQPAPWEPLNTLTWAKAMAWDLRDNMDTEIERSILLASMPAEQIADLFPAYDESRPIIVPDFAPPALNVQNLDSEFNYPQILADLLSRLDARVSAADELLGGDPFGELGSNSWVVSGELSATGAPLLANDPHLDAGMPSIWYQIGLHCAPKGPQCSYETVGVSFVGSPGIVIGHNARIAWGLTNAGADVMDLYVVNINPQNANQYEMNGEWVDMQVLEENVVVAGGETINLPVRLTRFGPIISDVYGDLQDFNQKSALDLPESFAIALRWTALDPGNTFQSILKINRAQNFEEFRAAASLFVAPSQNLLYADVDGNIGYQLPGLIPLRPQADGRYPVPGWIDDYEWLGYIDFDQMPYAYNPESGYIVAANNAVVGSDYPHWIADYWDYGYRAQRITDLLQAAPGPIDSAYYQRMQADTVNLGAQYILPYLAELAIANEDLNALRDQLVAWDSSQPLDSANAALFNLFWMELLKNTFHDQLPESYWPSGNSLWYQVVSNVLQDPHNLWWDDLTTENVETRTDILDASFAAAVERGKQLLGADPAKWAWGDLHTITFVHQTMDSFPIIGGLFNRGPFPVSGGSSIINATNWNPASGNFDVTSLPSKRSIMDLSNWQNSLQVNTTGQSGHAYHKHYIDMAETWAAVQYVPMHWDLEAIQADAEAHLRLLP
ncbi:MAG TPA: penicillin acylase family protein, partial [Anaerolineales bacterium]|nr:penicillin acylase family protein [Anaerolineales bacterium]